MAPPERTVLLLDPLLGDSGLGGLASAIKGRVEALVVPTIHCNLPPVLSATMTEALLERDDRSWDVVVSIRDGAGVAAQMVERGQARRAVLLDPLVGIPPLVGVAEALREVHQLPPPDLSRLQEVAERVTDEHVPDELLDGVAEGMHVDDPGLEAWRALFKAATRARLPEDPALKRDPKWWSDEWVDRWRSDPENVHPLFSARFEPLARALASATGTPVTVKPWNGLVWLTDPARVAAEVESLCSS